MAYTKADVEKMIDAMAHKKAAKGVPLPLCRTAAEIQLREQQASATMRARQAGLAKARKAITPGR